MISDPMAEYANDRMQDNISVFLQPDRALGMWISLAGASRSRVRLGYCFRSLMPGLPPFSGMNSTPAASRAARMAKIVDARMISPRSSRATVLGDTLAADASSRTPSPVATLAILHCAASKREQFQTGADGGDRTRSTGFVLSLLEQYTLPRPIEIVVLTAPQRPNESCETQSTEEQCDGDEIG